MRKDKIVVLVADDDETILHLIERSLQGVCDVLQARDGSQAVDMFRLGEDVIDLILLDLGMPKMSGYEALAELQLIDPDVNVAVITGLEPDPERLPGVRRILTKPFRPADVLALVDDLVSR